MILAELREATAPHHQSIEGAMPLFPSIDQEGYRRLLEKLWGFYHPLELIFNENLDERTKVLKLSDRVRVPSLEKDLSYFHNPKVIESLPQCHDLPEFKTWPEVFGAMYVIEGSSLGGQVITAHLQKLGFPKEICHFFNGYGAGTGKMWQGFLKELQSQVLLEADRALAVKAAQNTFTKLERWLRY